MPWCNRTKFNAMRNRMDWYKHKQFEKYRRQKQKNSNPSKGEARSFDILKEFIWIPEEKNVLFSPCAFETCFFNAPACSCNEIVNHWKICCFLVRQHSSIDLSWRLQRVECNNRFGSEIDVRAGFAVFEPKRHKYHDKFRNKKKDTNYLPLF